MSFNAWEIETNARYARERMEQAAAMARLVQAARTDREATPRPVLGGVLRGLGRRLIVAGERLGGATAVPPATTAGGTC